jgi:hypothetical protein
LYGIVKWHISDLKANWHGQMTEGKRPYQKDMPLVCT